MPGTHGFFGHLTSDQIFWKSWLDACINGRLRVWGRYNTTIVKSQALFLIDWFALKYTVGTLAPYLDEYFIRVEDKQGLLFAELSENLTSSIVEATNASALLVISNLDWYRNVLRELFASVNLNSKHCVLVRGPEYLDGLSHAELSDFEGVYLYTYKHRNFDEAFDALDQYVANGGNLIIDTGFECPESGSARLPGFFPVNETIRSSLGKEWNFTVSATSFTDGLNFSAFDPPIFMESPWTFSYAPSNSNVKPWARTILWNHGHPIIVVGNYGAGRVVWSGMNLPYHISEYKNLEEALFHKNLVEWSVQPQGYQNISCNVRRPRPEEAIIEGYENFKGILFKENAFEGWTAHLTSNGAAQELKIYRAGPDFMYVRVPSGIKPPFTVKFRYVGPLMDWFFATLSLATIIVVLDYSLLRGFVITNRVLRPIARGLRKRLVDRVRGWWYKEE